MTIKKLLLAVSVAVAPLVVGSVGLEGQGRGIEPSQLLKPLGDWWTSYSGDYTGRRFSALTDINRLTVKHLTLAWVAALNPSPPGVGAGGGRGGGRGGGAANVVIGGLGPGDINPGSSG